MDAVVITGVSTGIGLSATEILCESGYKVFGSVRKIVDADNLCSKYSNFKPLLFDVRDEDAIEDYQQAVKIAPDSYSGRLAIQRLKDLDADIVSLVPPRRAVDMFRPKIPSQTIKKHFVKIWSEMTKR